MCDNYRYRFIDPSNLSVVYNGGPVKDLEKVKDKVIYHYKNHKWCNKQFIVQIIHEQDDGSQEYTVLNHFRMYDSVCFMDEGDLFLYKIHRFGADISVKAFKMFVGKDGNLKFTGKQKRGSEKYFLPYLDDVNYCYTEGSNYDIIYTLDKSKIGIYVEIIIQRYKKYLECEIAECQKRLTILNSYESKENEPNFHYVWTRNKYE